MKPNAFRSRTRNCREAGQVMLFTLLALGVFLIGAMAFALDLSNVWFTRQSSQTAADAACTAGAMDMLVGATNGTMPSGANFTALAANTYDCNAYPVASSRPSPCSYAAMNGFGSSITRSAANSGTLGNNVYIDFPTAASVGLSSLNLAPTGVAAAALIRVRVTNNISTWFAGMLKGLTKMTTGASATCAVLQATSPIPILVLHPTMSASLLMNGGGSVSGTSCTPKPCGDIVIAGGPSKSIQVNSSSPTAINFNGGPTVDLCAGGNSYCGSNLGVWGPVPNPGTTNFWTGATCPGQNAGLCTGSQSPPAWNQNAPIADPLANTAAPQQPSHHTWIGTGSGKNPPFTGQTGIAGGSQGCPDTAGCVLFQPGYYPNGIDVKGVTAIFDPGVYFIGGSASTSGQCGPGGSGSVCLSPGGCMRPSSNLGDGSGGVMFYFADSNSIYAGGAGGGCAATVAPFNTATGANGLGVGCVAASAGPPPVIATQVPPNLPATLNGSVLLAPCQASSTTGSGAAWCAPNCGVNYGDPLVTADPYGEQRGILFFQSHSATGANPKWNGNGGVLLAGTMYFHDTGGSFTDSLDIGGTSGSSTYVLGDIIVDQLHVGGSGQIIMDLNPSAANTTLKAALVQ